MVITKELKERIDATILGVSKIFINDIVSGKKTTQEMIEEIENSEIPVEAQKLIAWNIGLYIPIKKEEEW